MMIVEVEAKVANIQMMKTEEQTQHLSTLYLYLYFILYTYGRTGSDGILLLASTIVAFAHMLETWSCWDIPYSILSDLLNKGFYFTAFQSCETISEYRIAFYWLWQC